MKDDMIPAEMLGGVSVNGAVATLVEVTADGVPMVEMSGQHGTVVTFARTIIDLASLKLGAQLVVFSDPSAPDSPVILGRIREPEPQLPQVEADGERLELTAEREIVLRCGKSSLTLTRSGKILLRGTHLVSRSTGVNKIKGGSIQLN